MMTRPIAGAVAGIVGTMAMSAAMRRLRRALPASERYPMPPREIADRLSPSGGAELGRREYTLAAHAGYGAACGAIMAAMFPRPGVRESALFGVGVWFVSYLGWIPALKVLTPGHRHPWRRNALMIAVHAVWGAAAGAALRELSDCEDQMFAQGRDRDAPGEA